MEVIELYVTTYSSLTKNLIFTENVEMSNFGRHGFNGLNKRKNLKKIPNCKTYSVISDEGYGWAEMAPGYNDQQFNARHNTLRAHARAYKVYQEEFKQSQKGQVECLRSFLCKLHYELE